jgi:protease I
MKEGYMADLATKHVAILVHDHFEQSEFVEPKEALEQAGAQVSVVSTGAETLHGMEHAEISDEFMPDMTIDEVDFDEFDLLVLPGGVINADKLRMDNKARDWVHYLVDHNKPIAAICHAPWLLVSAGVLDGVKLTSYYTLQDDIRNAHGNWVDAELVIDGNIITSRGPQDLPAFCDALIESLEREPAHSY